MGRKPRKPNLKLAMARFVLPIREHPIPQAERDIRAIAEAVALLEATLGGRSRLLAELASAPCATPEVDEVLMYLGDPRFDDVPLALLCQKAGIHAGDLFQAFKDATLAKAQLLAFDEVAKQTPAVVKDLCTSAITRKEPCQQCDGTGKIVPDPTPRNKTPLPLRCMACWGRGQIEVRGNLDAQKTVLELASLVKRPGGVTVQQNNLSASATFAGGGSLEQLQQALAQALYAAPAPARPLPATTVRTEESPSDDPPAA